MEISVYILYSPAFDKYYVGQTKDLSSRLSRHNQGTERSTAPYRPWTLVWHTQKPSRGEAMVLEKKIKKFIQTANNAIHWKIFLGRDDSALAECLGADLASAFESCRPDIKQPKTKVLGFAFHGGSNPDPSNTNHTREQRTGLLFDGKPSSINHPS